MTKGKKPRLLIATDNFLPRWDGIVRFLSEVIPRLAQDYEIIVVGPDFGVVENLDAHIIKIPLQRRQMGDFHLAKIRYRMIRREVKRCDIIFSQTVGPIGACAIIAAKRLKKPIVSFVHSIESRLIPMAIRPGTMRKFSYPIMHWWTRFLYNKSSVLITPSEWVDDHLSWEGVRTQKRVVRLGVDTKKFSPGTAKTIRTKLGIKDNEIVIGQHGRLAREKDLKTLLRAFIRLQAKHKNIRLLVIADGLREIKRMLDERDGVILAGRQDEVVPYLRAIDIFALTSLTETTCLATLEAMSCGLPVVSTPVGFVRDYVKEGENGFLFPKKDTFSLARHLEWLIKHPKDREKMGLAARKMVVEEFSWEQTYVGIKAVLDGISPS